MVKNTTGGTGAKSLARKHQSNNNNHNNLLRLPECDLEQIGCVTKMLGNGMCEVFTNDNVRLIARIRNSFQGKNKRNNLITPHSIVMVGLHEWERIPKNCDIMVLYTSNQIEQLKNIPNIKINHVLSLQLAGTTFQSEKNLGKDINFVDEEPEISPQQLPKDPINFQLYAQDAVNIDDI